MDIQSIRLKIERFIPLIIFLAAGTYYYLLSSKIFTWLYTSGDAGDWLALTNWWYVPHQWGKPLIVLYIRFLSLFPGDDVIKLTIALGIIPGAITVMFTYFIARRLTNQTWVAVTGCLVLMGAAIFTTQTTILEQYAFTAMFLTIAFFFQVRGQRKLTLLCLGLTTATHIIGLFLTFLWIACTWREWKEWAKVIPIYIVAGILPYALILGMMADPNTPKLVSGGLSLSSINSYLGNTASGVNLALVEAPHRLVQFGQIFTITLGFALVPLVGGLWKPDKLGRIAIAVSAFVVWFYITNLFPSVWKWSTMVLPIASAYIALGLTRLPSWHTRVVTVGAIVLIAANGFMFNASILANSDPQATEYMQALDTLPNNSCIIIPRGGQYGFTLFYAISEGKNLVPLAQGNPLTGTGRATFSLHDNPEESEDQSYIDYLAWLNRTYGIEGNNMYEIVQYCLDNSYNIYYGQTLSEIWSEVFIFAPEDSDKPYLQRIVAINPDFDVGKWENIHNA